MASTIVRPFEDADLPGAAAALVEVHATDGYPVEGVDQPERWLRSADVLAAWVAEVNGKIVGHISVMRPNDEGAVSMWTEQNGASKEQVAVLARLFVLAEARGRSTGERLIRVATDYAHRQGLRLVGDVMTKDEAAIRLYKRLGFRIIGTTMHTYGNGEQTSALCLVAPTP
ncbi:GNAT family N-acetyltransferase [Streptomyces sp. NPDC021100]|uniref:GNAT family N-acetyltransferase n=1 Tax=Streptomyces sp. NPDC021100 TaxID=3365114 RepID=UPI00379F3F70